MRQVLESVACGTHAAFSRVASMMMHRPILLGLALGLLPTGACDQPEPKPASCVEWLACYVGCRDEQYRRGEEDTVPLQELHGACIDSCLNLAEAAPEYPLGIEDALAAPSDRGSFWVTLNYCITDGGAL